VSNPREPKKNRIGFPFLPFVNQDAQRVTFLDFCRNAQPETLNPMSRNPCTTHVSIPRALTAVSSLEPSIISIGVGRTSAIPVGDTPSPTAIIFTLLPLVHAPSRQIGDFAHCSRGRNRICYDIFLRETSTG
jgi:hypothetical protein